MELTNAQKATLKAFVEADAVLNAIPKTADGAADIAKALNVVVPTFWVWKTTIQTSELFDALTWTAVDNLTVGKSRIFEWMILAGSVRPEQPSTRNGITQCFGAASATEVAILTLFKRNATRIEQLLANTTNGNGAEATPARLRVEGIIDYQDVLGAMGWILSSSK